jgi:hypothetical protein
MSYLHYTRERSRDRFPTVPDSDFYARPLVRRNSKRQRVDLYSDDEYDDYPYTTKAVQPTKPSRALTIRQPTQLEKYNVWSYPSPTHDTRAHDRHYKSGDYDYDTDSPRRFKYTTTTERKHYTPRRAIVLPSDDEDEDDNRHEREFKLKVKASFGRPKASLSRSNSFSANAYNQSQKAMAWTGDLFKRREKWEDTAWETKERRGAETRGFWEDEPKAAKEVRFRQIKRTRTNEWKPLSGFRRA